MKSTLPGIREQVTQGPNLTKYFSDHMLECFSFNNDYDVLQILFCLWMLPPHSKNHSLDLKYCTIPLIYQMSKGSEGGNEILLHRTVVMRSVTQPSLLFDQNRAEIKNSADKTCSQRSIYCYKRLFS